MRGVRRFERELSTGGENKGRRQREEAQRQLCGKLRLPSRGTLLWKPWPTLRFARYNTLRLALCSCCSKKRVIPRGVIKYRRITVGYERTAGPFCEPAFRWPVLHRQYAFDSMANKTCEGRAALAFTKIEKLSPCVRAVVHSRKSCQS